MGLVTHPYRIPEALRIGRPNPREQFSSVSDRQTLRNTRSYKRVIVSGPNFQNDTPPIQKFNQPGDHLYCHEISGTEIVQVVLGLADNPPIELQRGMVIQREFESFTVHFLGRLAPPHEYGIEVVQRTIAELYASYGALMITPGERSYGMTTDSLAFFDNVASAVAREVWGDIITTYDALGLRNIFGRHGCSIAVKNEEDLSHLYLKYGYVSEIVGTSLFQRSWWRLEPKQTIVLDVDNRLFRKASSTLLPDEKTLIVATQSGTAKYSFWVNRAPFIDKSLDYPDSPGVYRTAGG